MEQLGNTPVFNISRTLFENIPRNFIGDFFQIYWEYLMWLFHEHSTIIYLFIGWVLVFQNIILELEDSIGISNTDDNECFKWCLVRYLKPADYKSRRITKADKDFAKRLDFKDIKFSVKIRDIHKIETKNCICISILAMKIKKNIHSVYQSNLWKKNMLIGEGEKSTMFLSKILSMIIHYVEEKTFLLLLFTSFHYRRNFKASH